MIIDTPSKAIEKRMISTCPECNGADIVHRTRLGGWRCHDCEHVCDSPVYRKSRSQSRVRGYWSLIEIKFLKENYRIMKPSAIADHLGRSVSAVYSQAKKEDLVIKQRCKNV